MKQTLAKILMTMQKMGVPGSAIDLTDPDIVRAYVLVLESRGITAELLKESEAKILDSKFFPRPYDVAEACTHGRITAATYGITNVLSPEEYERECRRNRGEE